jgi:hypothetical protein
MTVTAKRQRSPEGVQVCAIAHASSSSSATAMATTAMKISASIPDMRHIARRLCVPGGT